MSEMVQTADHLLVIGKGRLIADTSVDEFVRSSSRQSAHVRSPQAAELAAAHSIALSELVPVKASLEAFMELTRDSVEYQAVGAAPDHRAAFRAATFGDVLRSSGPSTVRSGRLYGR